jgi:hypothetical protein
MAPGYPGRKGQAVLGVASSTCACENAQLAQSDLMKQSLTFLFAAG